MSVHNIVIDTGYCKFKIDKIPSFALEQAKLIYPDIGTTMPSNSEFDFSIKFVTRSPVRRFISRQLDFYVDDFNPFRPVPYREAYAFLEWSMNWCVTALLSTDFKIHAAILEKNGKAVIFPAPSGSGKSTLTAHLMLNGWRLLSDEMTIIEPSTGLACPSVRPICLKNNSIDLVKAWGDDIVITKPVEDTNKGTVAHVKPSALSYEGRFDKVKPVGIFYPRYDANIELDLYELNKTNAFAKVVENAFNFSILGSVGFETVSELTNSCWHIEGHYNDLELVREFLEEQIEQA